MKVTQHRTQMLLDTESYLWLKKRSREKEASIAQVVREVIHKERKKEERQKRKKYSQAYRELLSLAGSITEKDGVNDVSVNHDKYLGDALYKEIVSKRRK